MCTLLNEVYLKGQIFKMTLFSPIDLDKIMPKKSKIMEIRATLKKIHEFVSDTDMF